VSATDMPYTNYNTISGNLSFKVHPQILLPSYQVGGDEGCMCMYFKNSNNVSYFSEVSKQVSYFLKKKYSGYSITSSEDAPFFIVVNSLDNGNYEFLFEIKNQGRIMSTFRHKNIPKEIVQTQSFSRENGLKDGFFKKTTFLLLKNNLIASKISSLLNFSYFPHKEFQEFLDKAIEIEP
jgi:hypothetical protein